MQDSAILEVLKYSVDTQSVIGSFDDKKTVTNQDTSCSILN